MVRKIASDDVKAGENPGFHKKNTYVKSQRLKRIIPEDAYSHG